MSWLPKIAIVTVLTCLALMVAAWAVRAVYQASLARAERIDDLERRVEMLHRTAHPPWTIRKRGVTIRTVDSSESTKSTTEMHLIKGAKSAQKFEDFIGKLAPHRRVVAAWISDWKPRSEMAKFEQLDVVGDNGGRFEVWAKADTDEPVAMEFTVTFIVE